MKIICLSDIHFRESNPVNRVDNYLDILCEKLTQIRDKAKEFNTIGEKIIVVIAGDVFDSFRASHALKIRVIETLSQMYEYADEIFGIAGQHDMRYHSNDLSNTPIGVLFAANVMTYLFEKDPYIIDKFHFYGMDFKEKMNFNGISVDAPLPRTYDKNAFNILVIHRNISNKDYWNGHVDYYPCETLLKEARDFSLIISGDNHVTFNYKNKILNPGSVMRSRIDQKDHKPGYFVYDTNTRKAEFIEFIIEPFEKVMRLDEVAESKELDSKLMSFVDEINLDYEFEELKFVDNVRAAIKKTENEEVKSILLECIKDLE